MKGYLQRLGISAAMPRSSLHPFVGSLYSAARPQETVDASSLDDALATFDDTRPGYPDVHAPAAPADRLPTSDAAKPAVQRDLAIGHQASGTAPQLLPAIARYARDSTSRAGSETDATAADKPFTPVFTRYANAAPKDRKPIHGAPRENAHAQPTGPGTHDTDEARFVEPTQRPRRPGDDVSAVDAEPTREIVRVPAREPSPRKTQPRSLVPLTRSASVAGPADVEIHIGRIEVVGVPTPASPRSPAAPAARKSSSLDDYLRRRNGGGR